MADSEPDVVFNRKFLPPDDDDFDDDVDVCERCGGWAMCAWGDRLSSRRYCYHYRLAFVDGACFGNGYEGARSGLGIELGDTDRTRYAISVDDDIDDDVRTSQRAELLAAIHGLERLGDFADDHSKYERINVSRSEMETSTWIIGSDSQYVIKGLTEWYPRWRRNGWCKKGGGAPANLDLFHRLNKTVKNLEKQHITVGFWKVSRSFNSEADKLAKQAARDADSVYYDSD